MSGFTTGGANVRERLLRLRLADDRIAVPQRLPHARLDARALAGPTLPEFSRLIRSIAGSIAKRPTSLVVTGPEEDAPARAEAAIHLAAGLVGHAYRTVVVDTDFAHQGLAGLIPDPTLEGVIDMLRFGRSCRSVLLTPAPGGPSLLPAGSFPPEIPLAFDLDTLRGLVHRVSVNCDVALFVGPLAVGSQVNGLIQVCDSVLYAARVRPEGVGRIEGPLGELERHGVAIAGAVVYLEPEPAPLSVTFPPPLPPPPPAIAAPRPAPAAVPTPFPPPQPEPVQPFASTSSQPFEVEEVTSAAPSPAAPTDPSDAFQIRLPPHPVPDVGVTSEPAESWSPPAPRGPLEYETDAWPATERRGTRPTGSELRPDERADDLDLEDTEFAYEDTGRYSRTPLYLLLTLLVLIGGFLGWALWTKRGMERQVGNEWGAANRGEPAANTGPGGSDNSPPDLDDGAAAEAVRTVPDTAASQPVSEPSGVSPQPQGPDTARASDQEARSNSTFVAVGGQRLETGSTPDVVPPAEKAPVSTLPDADAKRSEPTAATQPPAPGATAAARTGAGLDTARDAAPEAGDGTSGSQVAPVTEQPYALHVGSYRTIEKAYEDIANLQKRGYEGRAVRTDLGSKGVWYRVYVGAYPSRTEALAASRSLLELPEYKYAQVVRVPRP